MTQPPVDVLDQLAPWNDRWHEFVPAPRAAIVPPVGVAAESGGISGINGFLEQTAALRLECDDAESPVSVVLDYGTVISGHPRLTVITVQTENGPARLTADYSESRRYLRAGGDLQFDGMRVAGNPYRAEHYDIEEPGTIRQRFLQGGFRYQRLQLHSPGAVELSAVAVEYRGFRGTPDTYQGYFLCSDEQLNRIWYAGAHTVHLNMLPAGTDAGYWSIENDALDIRDGWTADNSTPLGVLTCGRHWRDYDVDFDCRLERGRAGWVVRGAVPGIGLILSVGRAETDRTTVRAEVQFDSDYDDVDSLGEVDVPAPGSEWMLVSTSVRGTEVQVRLEGQLAGSWSIPDKYRSLLESGTVGFCARAGDAAKFRGLRVRGVNGDVLAAISLSRNGDLSAFHRPGVSERPLLLDGPKRDRLVWQGDYLVSARALFTISDAIEYARESLRLLASHQLTGGYIPANSSPSAPLRTSPPDHGKETVRYPSASYSLYHIVNLHDYWWHSDDLGFVSEMWPSVEKQLQWNLSRTNAEGLLVIDERDGMGWRYSQVAGVAGYENVLYVHALRCAAELADALGHRDAAIQLGRRGAMHREAVDAFLFDRERGIYRFTTDRPDPVVLDANATAVHHGLLPGAAAHRALDLMLSELDTPFGLRCISNPPPAGQFAVIGPMMSGVALWALADNDRLPEALDQIRRCWGRMVDTDPHTTVWEVMGVDGSWTTPGINSGGGGNTSLSHAYSAGPTVAMTRYVLGIQATVPGFAEWSVRPQTGGLAWALGVMPTPHGPLAVRWAAAGAGLFELEVTAPAGTRGSVCVPVPDEASRLEHNGSAVQIAPQDGRIVVLIPGGTTHRFRVR